MILYAYIGIMMILEVLVLLVYSITIPGHRVGLWTQSSPHIIPEIYSDKEVDYGCTEAPALGYKDT